MSEIHPEGTQDTETKELGSIKDLANSILTEKPEYVIISDQHINSEPQDVAKVLIESLCESSSYIPGQIGFYVEALYSTSDPSQNNFDGGVVKWDEFKDRARPTNYRSTIQIAVDKQIPTHGVDLNKNIDSESEERMQHWEQVIKSGAEPTKILLVGGGHLWNDQRNTADIMKRLGKNQWVIENEKAYSPPGSTSQTNFDLSASVKTDRKYILLKYKNS